MATTLQARVADLIGTVSDLDAVKDALETGCKFIIDLMNEEVLEENSAPLTVTTSGYDISDLRIHYAHKNSYGARKILPELRASVQDTGSIHYALPTDPVYTIYNGKIYIYPSGGTLMQVPYPSITTVTATGIDGLQTKYEQLVVYYASIQLLFHTINEIYGDIDTVIAALPSAPSAIDDPDFSYTDIEAPSVSVSASVPTYTKPAFLGDFDTLDTPLDTEEDITLSDAHLGRISQYLNQYRADIDNEVNEFRKELEIYQADVQVSIKYADMVLTAAIKNQDAELQQQVSEYKGKIEKHMAAVQSYGTQIQSWATQVKTQIELITSKLGLMKELQGQLKVLLEVHLGVRQ
jgi:hypothetical protein